MLVSILLALLMFFMLLKSSKVQTAAVHLFTNQLSKQLQAKVSIQTVDYEWFNTLNVNDIYIEDRSQDTLLYIHNLVAHFNFWAFFRQKISFSRVEINDLSLHLSTDDMGHANFEFLLNAFNSPQEVPFLATVNVDEIYLNNTSLRYRTPRASTTDLSLFSPDNVQITNLNARFSLQHFSADSIAAQINHLSFKEQSGLELSDFQAQLLANKAMARMPHLRLRLPRSELTIGNVEIELDSLLPTLFGAHFDIPIKQAQITFSDLAAFVPIFKNMNSYTNVTAHLIGSLDDLQVDDLQVAYNGRTLFKGNVNLNGWPNLSETFIYASVSEMLLTKSQVQDFVSDLQKRPYVLPDWINSLGNIRYTGVLSGFPSNMVAFGSFSTLLGAISTDLLLQTDSTFQNLTFGGHLKTNRFQLGKLLNNNDIGDIAFRIQTEGSKTQIEPLNGSILATVQSFTALDYTYRDIQIDGKYNVGGFDGKLSVEDEHLSCQFEGLVDLTQELPVLNFELDLDKIHLQELHLAEQFPNSNLAFHSSINCIGNSLDNLNGYILLDSLKFSNGAKSFDLDRLVLLSNVSDEKSSITIQSPYINAGFTGKYHYSTLPITAKKIIANYLPTLIPEVERNKIAQQQVNNEMEFYAYLKDIDLVCNVLNLPISISGMQTIKGFINDSKQQCALQLLVPTIKMNQLQLDNFTFDCNNRHDRLNLSAVVHQGSDEHRIECLGQIAAHHDSIFVNLDWDDRNATRNEGSFQLMAHISQYAQQPLINVNILPSQIIMADSLLEVSNSQIVYTAADTTLLISNFRFGNQSQYIYADGVASTHQEDSITVQLKDLELGYILGFLPMGDVSFAGRATGSGTVYGLLNQPMFDASVFLQNARINNSPVGDATAFATWNRENKTIDIVGKVVADTDTVADIIGLVSPKIKRWDLWITAAGVNLQFINHWTKEIMQDIDGKAYGNVHVFGIEQQTWVEGKALAKDAGLTIGMLGTRYHFTDSVTLKTDAISFNNITLFDNEGNKAVLNGSITHNGFFQQIKYIIDIDCHNLMAMNTTITDNDFFFGKVFATGRVNIKGNEIDCRIKVNARTEPRTNFNISLGSSAVASDNSFITFVNYKAPAVAHTKEQQMQQPTSRVRLELQVNVTPDALIQVIIDPKTGDVISGKGIGDLTLDYDTNGDVKLFGTYTLESGSYMFTLQNFIRKEFKINQGSNIVWAGDPFNAQVDIKGMYSVTASLRDLMGTDIEQLSTNRLNIPVNCMLLLSGNLMNPNIKFGIDLPNSDEGVKQQVNTIINTDEMIMRQMIYLLVFNKFYTPEYLQASTSIVGTGEVYSLLSSTVTGQINNWISKLTKDFTVGFNVRISGEGEYASQEYETQFLYQPNNRLIINGNLGYRNDDISDKPIFGDLDVEYLLTPSGKIRAKAYTHTVDKYSLKEAHTVQGVGLMYKEDFNTIGELLNNYWEDLKSIFKKREKQNKKEAKKTPKNTDNK